MNKKLRAVGMIIPFAAAAMVATAPAASARTVAAQASGRCSMGSHWTMKAKPDNGRMELELEVDSKPEWPEVDRSYHRQPQPDLCRHQGHGCAERLVRSPEADGQQGRYRPLRGCRQ